MTAPEPVGDPFGDTLGERLSGRLVGAGAAALALMALLFFAPVAAVAAGVAVYVVGIPLSFAVEAVLGRRVAVTLWMRVAAYVLSGAIAGAWLSAAASLFEPAFAIWLLPYAVALGGFAGLVAPLAGTRLTGVAAALVGGMGPAGLLILAALV
jgi:hypothetical protein